MSGERQVLTHLHFYQPPRNPWHRDYDKICTDPDGIDYTEKIHNENYSPLTKLGILPKVSFNISYVLLDELSRRGHTETAAAFFNGTEKSMTATSYSHQILPHLTQTHREIVVLAGLLRHRRGHNMPDEDLREIDIQDQPKQDKYRSSKYSKDKTDGTGHIEAHEVFWAPETAMSMETAETLEKFGIKAFLCAPWQIKLPDNRLADNTPVRIKLPNHKSIIAIPYDREYSSKLGYGDKSDSYRFIDEIVARRSHQNGGKPIFGATDGETFGHHAHFADLFLEYFLNKAMKNRGFQSVLIGDIDFSNIPDGELHDHSAWSCHCGGLVRWLSGCSCAKDFTNWKVIFYETFKGLADEVTAIGTKALGKGWAKRIAYNFEKAMKHPGPSENTKPEDSLEAAVVAALIARTSCGTFFNNPGTSGMINILFGTVAIQHLYDAGLTKKARLLEANYVANLAKVIDPYSSERTAKDMMEDLLNQRLRFNLIPAMMGLNQS